MVYGVPFWAVLVAAILIGGGIAFIRHLNRQIHRSVRSARSEMSRAYAKQDCLPCDGLGGFDITDPGRVLDIAEALSSANVTTCGCCQGAGHHNVIRGTKWVCKSYA
jgi:hypothetical protein